MGSADRGRVNKMPHLVIVRAPGLLPMIYKVNDLAQDLGISPRTVRDWAHSGMPHQRDQRGHIWINGRDFAEWIGSMRRSANRPALGADEDYCMRCNRPVRIVDAVLHTDGVSTLFQGSCPCCGTTVNRGVSGG